jgi:uncharacterized membrane-anchored protein
MTRILSRLTHLAAATGLLWATTPAMAADQVQPAPPATKSAAPATVPVSTDKAATTDKAASTDQAAKSKKKARRDPGLNQPGAAGNVRPGPVGPGPVGPGPVGPGPVGPGPVR